MGQKFAIIEPDPVVRMDLFGIVRDVCPDADVVTTATIDDLPDGVIRDVLCDCLIVNSRHFAGHAVQQLSDMAAQGCRIIVYGEPVDVPYPTVHIPMPFTTDMIAANLCGEKPGGREEDRV